MSIYRSPAELAGAGGRTAGTDVGSGAIALAGAPEPAASALFGINPADEAGPGVVMGAWPLGPGGAGGAGVPGDAGIRSAGAAAWPGLPTSFAVRNTTSSRRVVSVRSFLNSQPSTGTFASQGTPSRRSETLLAKAGDHNCPTVEDVGLGDGLAGRYDRGDQERRIDPLSLHLVLHGDCENRSGRHPQRAGVT